MVSVHGMRCGGCARVVALAVRRISGVKSADTDPVSETAVVVFDPRKTQPDAILREIEAAGFNVRHVNALVVKRDF